MIHIYHGTATIIGIPKSKLGRRKLREALESWTTRAKENKNKMYADGLTARSVNSLEQRNCWNKLSSLDNQMMEQVGETLYRVSTPLTANGPVIQLINWKFKWTVYPHFFLKFCQKFEIMKEGPASGSIVWIRCRYIIILQLSIVLNLSRQSYYLFVA